MAIVVEAFIVSSLRGVALQGDDQAVRLRATRACKARRGRGTGELGGFDRFKEEVEDTR
jgi:hypothetical protein